MAENTLEILQTPFLATIASFGLGTFIDKTIRFSEKKNNVDRVTQKSVSPCKVVGLCCLSLSGKTSLERGLLFL